MGTSIPEVTYIGSAGIAEMNVSFSVRCAADYYGQECLNFCPNFVSCTGCDLSGFTGEFCQLVTDDCDVNCNSRPIASKIWLRGNTEIVIFIH